MSDRDPIRALADLVREDEQRARAEEPAWIARAKGTPSAELEARDDDLARHMREATGPADDATIDRFTAAALAASGQGPARAAEPAPPRSSVVDLARAREGRRGGGWVAGVAAALALAAGAILYLRTTPSGDGPRGEMPTYALEVSGGDAPVRGDDAGPAAPRTSIGRGAYVRIALRPERAVDRPVEAIAFLLRGGEGRTVSGTIDRAQTGAIRIEGAREALFGDATGPWDLVVFVGDAAALPRDPSAARDARGAGDPRRQVLVAPIELSP